MIGKNGKAFFILSFFGISAFLLHFTDLSNSDEGFVLNGVWKMMGGQMPYVDFPSFIPPGSYYFLFGAFQLLGAEYGVARFVSVALLLASVWAMYKIVFSFTGRSFLAVIFAWIWLFSSVFFDAVIINHNALSSYVAVIAICALVCARQKKDARLFLLGGFLIGLVVAFLQTKGLALAAGLGALFVFETLTRKQDLKHTASFCFGALVIPAVISAVWGPIVLYEQLILWPQTHYLDVNRVSAVPLAAAVGLFLVIAVAVWNLKKPGQADLIRLFVVVQACSFASIFNRPEAIHISLNIFALLALTSGIFVSSAKYFLKEERVLKPFVAPVFFLVSVLLLGCAIQRNLSATALTQNVERCVNTYEIEEFYAHPFLSGLYFSFKRPDPYPHSFLLTGMHEQGEFEENLRVIKEQRPGHILLDYGIVEKFGFDKTNILDAYIWQHYDNVGNCGSVLIMKRID